MQSNLWLSMPLDGFIAGDNMTLENPFGTISPMLLNGWQFNKADKNKAEREASVSAGVFIMGRNIFGPKVQSDPSRKSWWDNNPPYCAGIRVVSHEHEPIVMEGGTTFYFVMDGIEPAMKQVQKAAGSKGVADD